MTTTPTPSFETEQRGASCQRSLRKWSFVASAVVFAVLIWQCSSALYTSKKQSDEASRQFHQQLNAGQFEEICTQADERFGGQNSQEAIKFLQVVHDKLGSAGVSTFQNIRVQTISGSIYFFTSYKTTFDEGSGVETFTWVKSDGSLKLVRYHIDSRELVMK